MNIYFDFEIFQEYSGLISNIEASAYLREIKTEVESILQPISEQMESEELNPIDAEATPHVMIFVIKEPFQVFCVDYSPEVSGNATLLLKELEQSLIPKWELARKSLFN